MTNERLALIVGELKQRVRELESKNETLEKNLTDAVEFTDEKIEAIIKQINEKIVPYIHSHR